MTWQSLPFPETIRKTRIGRENQIPASEIKPAGQFPVIDQGQAFIAGYSDDEKRAIKDELPLVIFGDHTRVIKFVDFPFILGADGTKVLKPREDKFEARFFAFALESLNLPSRGYNRHFTLLKERHIVRPELPEQRKIAGVLRSVQQAMEQQERLLALTAELKKALVHQLFTHGLRQEPQKETEIGQIPKGWETVRVAKVGQVITGSTPSTKREEYYGGDYNLISPVDLDAGKYVRTAHRKLTKEGFKQCRALPGDAVMVGCIGNIGKIGMTANEKSATNQQINSIVCNKDFNPHFVFYSLQFHRPRLEQAAAKVTVPILNKSNFENFQIAAPHKPEQDEIADALSILDRKIEQTNQKKQSLTNLFRTLLHELMTARIRVDKLDLSVIESSTDD